MSSLRLGRASVIRADARALPLPDASVDLIVTSPPYWGLRDYRDGDASLAGQIGAEPTPAEYIAALLECTRDWMRVLKPSGSLFVNLADKYSDRADGGPSSARSGRGDRAEVLQPGRSTTAAAPRKSRLLLPEQYRIGCVYDLGLTARAVIIWSKPNGLPESVTDRVCTSHEDWVHLVKAERYFSALDEIREPYADSSVARSHLTQTAGPADAKRIKAGDKSSSYKPTQFAASPLGKLPSSVWEIATQPLAVPDHLGIDHFAAFPPALVRKIILGWSPQAGLVADPFGGTGTTALVARALGRNAISFDLSADYCRLARWRTSDPGELARVLGKPKPPQPVDGQLGLDLEAS